MRKKRVRPAPNMSLLALVFVTLLGACSTGIVPMDQGRYMVSQQSTGGGFGNPESVKADLYRDANEFCAKQGQFVQTVKTTTTSGIPMVRIAAASLEFRCVPRAPAPAASEPQ